MSEVRKFPVVTGNNQSLASMSEEIVERIKEVVYSYSGQMPVALAIGAIYIAAKEILDHQYE